MHKKVDTIAQIVDTISQAVDTIAQIAGTIAQAVDKIAQIVDTIAQMVDTIAQRGLTSWILLSLRQVPELLLKCRVNEKGRQKNSLISV